MYLITKNKIADYIRQHPEAQATFLTWIKEFPYVQGKNMFKDIDGLPVEHMLTGWFGLGRGDYQIKYTVNPWLKTGYITWLGTKEALVEYEEAEFEKRKAQDPGLHRKVVTTTIEIKMPGTSGGKIKGVKGKVVNQNEGHASVGVPVDLTPVHLGNAPEIFPARVENYVASELDIKTESEYENALSRAIALFDSRPGTPEFDELTILLQLIMHYEAGHIELPRLAILDAIRLKMELIEMPSSFLTHFIGSQEEVDQFLAGESTLSEKTLQVVCDKLFIRIPLKDKSLIK